LEELNITPVIVSSLGASTYGANEPGMSWADIELLLSTHRILSHRSLFVTPGADADTGGGLPEGGMDTIKWIAARTESPLCIPASFAGAVMIRESIMTANAIAMLINIGGNHAVLGNCTHASSIPNGFHDRLASCRDEERGLLMRLSEKGIPIVHFLNIRDMAQRYEIEENGINTFDSQRIYSVQKSGTIYVSVTLIMIVGLVFIASRYQRLRR
jgi:poly-gamma-glutamate system protein